MRYELVEDGVVKNGDYVFTTEWIIQLGLENELESFIGWNIREENLIVKRPLTTINKFLVNDNLHHNDVDITIALRSLASQELNDGEEYDLMMVAADYIESLRESVK